jgi:hypothetical protein
MFLPCHQNARKNHNIKITNRLLEDVAQFKYLWSTVTNKTFIQDEIKKMLNLGYAFYHSIQNLLSSYLLSKNMKIRKYKTIILLVVLYGYETWSLELREKHKT